MRTIEQWSEQLALGGKSWVIRHEAEEKLRALEAKVAELKSEAGVGCEDCGVRPRAPQAGA